MKVGYRLHMPPTSAILIETEELLEPTEVTARVEDPEYVRSLVS